MAKNLDAASRRAAALARTEYEAAFLGALIALDVETYYPGLEEPVEIDVQPDQPMGRLNVDLLFLREGAVEYEVIRLCLTPRRIVEESSGTEGRLDVSAERPADLAQAVAEWLRATLDPPPPKLEFELD